MKDKGRRDHTLNPTSRGPTNGVQFRVEETIEETFTFYRLPRQHHKHLKSTNMLERPNEEIKRRTHVVRIFPNAESCQRLVRALAVETHENWLEAHRYLNMNDLREHKKTYLRNAAEPSRTHDCLLQNLTHSIEPRLQSRRFGSRSEARSWFIRARTRSTDDRVRAASC